MLDRSRHLRHFFHIAVTNHGFWFVLVFGCLILLCVTLRMSKTKKSTNVIVSNPLKDNILFSTFYTGMFLLLGKNWGGGAHAPSPPGPSLAAAQLPSVCCEYKSVLTLLLIQLC